MKIPIDPLKFIPLASWFVRVWFKTIRFEAHGNWEQLQKANESGDRFVAALWHGDLFSVFGFATQIGGKYAGLVSQSKDGEIAARLIESFGHTCVRGSSSRGGMKALLQLKRILSNENKIGVFAADGPRGPRHQTKEGIIFLAQRVDAQIIPVRAYPQKSKILNSWDKFVLPFPFTKCIIHIAEPVTVTSEKLDKDVMAKEKTRLNEILNSLGAEDQE